MRIAIIEDEAPIRNGLANILPKLAPHYQVVGMAADGAEGIKLVEEMVPDLIILDIQMPEMDGLTMLGRLREKGITCKAVVLTAYSDFAYAKRAIELDIENYLLKPIKIPELKETLSGIQKTILEAQGEERLQERLLSLEQIFRGSILAELPVDEELDRVARARYGLDVRGNLAVFSVWLGEHYEGNSSETARIMQIYTEHVTDYAYTLLFSTRYQVVIAVLYNIKDPDVVAGRYENILVPAIRRGISCEAVFSWEPAAGLVGLPDAFARITENRKWNLSVLEGTLLTSRNLEALSVVPFKYPMYMEERIREALMERKPEKFAEVFEQFRRGCAEELHHPDEIRENCTRFGLGLLAQAQSSGKVKADIATRTLIGALAQAVVWGQIRNVLQKLYAFVIVEEEEASYSLLVNRAITMIEEYYSQGITLEELAQKLCVSEEYLSTQIKKETGMSFTETVRKYRIDRVKELLVHSNLKLNQIADMVGYSDPKYMSKVFKEAVGVLPAQYRKQPL